MKPVDQSRMYPCGDCMAACVASIFEVPIEKLPHLDEVKWAGRAESASTEWWTMWFDFLYRNNLHMYDIPFNEYRFPRAYCVVYGTSPRVGQHSCVWFDGELVHDPHPSRDGLAAKVGFLVFYPVDPMKPVLAEVRA